MLHLDGEKGIESVVKWSAISSRRLQQWRRWR